MTTPQGPGPDGSGTDGFGTTVEEMQRAALLVQQVDDAVRDELRMLRTRLIPLAAGWRGEAAGAFERLMARWDADAVALSEALRTIGAAIEGSGAGYGRLEEEHRAGLSGIRAALG